MFKALFMRTITTFGWHADCRILSIYIAKSVGRRLDLSDDLEFRGLSRSKFKAREAFIQTGERTALAYLTKPFMDQVARAFREE